MCFSCMQIVQINSIFSLLEHEVLRVNCCHQSVSLISRMLSDVLCQQFALHDYFYTSHPIRPKGRKYWGVL